MGKRREARERAVQFLFQHDLNPPDDLNAAVEQFWESQGSAAIAVEKGNATWGEKPELPPPSADELAIRLFDRGRGGALSREDSLCRPTRSVAERRGWWRRRLGRGIGANLRLGRCRRRWRGSGAEEAVAVAS